VDIVTNNVQVTWTSISGNQYRLQYKTNLTDAAWVDLPTGVTASGPNATGWDTVSAAGQRFYRVRLDP
jgi:hypothetical protein